MRSSSTTTVPATVTALPPSISFAVLQLLSTTSPHPSNNSDPQACVENAHDLASSASPGTMPAAGQQEEQDVAVLPVDSSRNSDFAPLPVSDTPPQYLSFLSDTPSPSDATFVRRFWLLTCRIR